MSDSPSKRARERRKAEKRRQKKTRFENRPPEMDDASAIAARYLDPTDEEILAAEETARVEAAPKSLKRSSPGRKAAERRASEEAASGEAPGLASEPDATPAEGKDETPTNGKNDAG